MKKWIWIVSIAVLALLGYIAASVLAGIDQKRSAEERAEGIAKNEGGLESVDKFYLYHGAESYSVIIGPDKKGTDYVLFIPDNLKKEKVIKMKYSSGYSESEIIGRVKREHNPYQIVSVKLGMKKRVPIWEITVKDEEGNLKYIAYNFKKQG